jgi:hypothetical protein
VGFFEDTIRALNVAQVRNVVVGDLAVVLHGYLRLTPDLDLTVHVPALEARKAAEILGQAGSSAGAARLALVADEREEFESVEERSVVVSLESTTVRALSLENLILRKRLAGGPLDLNDAEILESIRQEQGGVSPAPRDGWEEHHQNQMKDLLRTTPSRRLAAFEEMIEFARKYAGLARRGTARGPGETAAS